MSSCSNPKFLKMHGAHSSKLTTGRISLRLVFRDFVQDNQSISTKNVLRGLHYQSRQAQRKLVRVLRGEIFDVAVDCRKSSPAFPKFVSVRLSSVNRKMLWIPEGFAHGFLVISESAEVLHKTTDLYATQHERTLRWNDPRVAIPWPCDEPVLSDKDRRGQLLEQAEIFE